VSVAERVVFGVPVTRLLVEFTRASRCARTPRIETHDGDVTPTIRVDMFLARFHAANVRTRAVTTVEQLGASSSTRRTRFALDDCARVESV